MNFRSHQSGVDCWWHHRPSAVKRDNFLGEMPRANKSASLSLQGGFCEFHPNGADLSGKDFLEVTMDKNEFKTMRLNCGLTQTELAAKLGISFGTLNRWERGHFEINQHAATIFRQNAKAWTIMGKK